MGLPGKERLMSETTNRCECADPQCPVRGCHACIARNRAETTLYRVDMEDHTGTRMCALCADDAMGSGLFRTDREEGPECKARGER